MKRNRVWIEIVILGTAVACVLALLLATLGAAAGAAEGAVVTRQQTDANSNQAYDGMVTCSRCGAKHSPAIGQTASICTRLCVHGGASFALVDADGAYLLDGDLNILKRLAGRRAHVVGALKGRTISSVTAET